MLERVEVDSNLTPDAAMQNALFELSLVLSLKATGLGQLE